MQKPSPSREVRGLGRRAGAPGGLAVCARRRGAAGRGVTARRCVNQQGNPWLHLGAARKLHHVWAATSEGADPPLWLGDTKSSSFPTLRRLPDCRRCRKVRGGLAKLSASERRSSEVTRASRNAPHPQSKWFSPRISFIKRKDSVRSE